MPCFDIYTHMRVNKEWNAWQKENDQQILLFFLRSFILDVYIYIRLREKERKYDKKTTS